MSRIPSQAKLSMVLLMLLTPSLLSGCWNWREINTLGIVAGMGMDLAGKPGKILLSTQVVNPNNIRTPESGGSTGGQPVTVVKCTGDTIFDAVRSLTFQLERKIYFPHNQIIVIGKELAETGVSAHLDFFLRDHENRRSVWVLVSESKAYEVLEAKLNLEKISAVGISHMVEGQRATSKTATANLHEFMNRIMSKTTAPVASYVHIHSEGKEKKIQLSGTAVFKSDKLVGSLNRTQTRGLLWVIGKIKSGIIVVNVSGKKQKVSMEIISAKSKITPRLRYGKVHIEVEVSEEGNVGCQTVPEELTKPEVMARLERLQSAVIKREILAALAKARELNTDIFGFGEAIHRKYAKEWKGLETSWDSVFPTIEVKVAVNSKLRRVGAITKSAAPE
jgi:spore germination protein KC